MLCLLPDARRAHKSNSLLQCAGRRDALADDVERRAVRRRREHRPQSAGHGDAAIETLQLRGDLSLVVVHRQYAVVVAGKGLEEHGIRRKGSPAPDAALGRPRDRRRDDLDFLAPEEAVLAAVRVECGDGDARCVEAGAAHGAIRQRDGRVDAFRRDLVERRPQRDMRGHARHPQIVEHVHLAEESLMPGEMREQLVLVVEAPAAGVEGGLVERCERDAVDPFLEGEIDHVAKASRR